VNFFQPSFKLKEKRREGTKIIKRYHAPATPCERGLAHPAIDKAIKRKLRELRRSLDPVALLAEVREAQAPPSCETLCSHHLFDLLRAAKLASSLMPQTPNIENGL
jgi:hypothetical protein